MKREAAEKSTRLGTDSVFKELHSVVLFVLVHTVKHRIQNNGRLAHKCKVGLAVERNCLNILLIMCSRSQCEIYPLNETGRCDNPISVDFTSDI